MKQFFVVMVLLAVLGCVAFVGWQIINPSESETQLQQAVQEQSVDEAAQATIQSTTTQTISSKDSVPENIETEVAEEPEPDQIAVEESEPEITSTVGELDIASRKEHLLEARRALAKAAYELDLDVSDEMRDDILNPSPELLDILLEPFMAEELTEQELEDEYLLFDYLFRAHLIKRDWVALNGPTLNPLPEPAGYREAESISQDAAGNIFRYAIAANSESPVEVYAVDNNQKFSGIIQSSDGTNSLLEELSNVEASSFAGDYGIDINLGTAGEFNVMLRGTDFGIAFLYYSIYEEGDTKSFSLPVITTPNMLASATWAEEIGKVDLYKWRIDYDSDGKVDFLLSQNATSEQQAEEMIDFVVNMMDQKHPRYQQFTENEDDLVELLTDEKYR